MIKKETLAQVFSYEFCEIFKNNFFPELLRVTAPGHLFNSFGLVGSTLLIANSGRSDGSHSLQKTEGIIIPLL